VTKRNDAPARSKACVMLRRSWQAGLQLEIAKRILTAARKVVLDLLNALQQPREEKNWVAEASKRPSWEVR